MMKKCLHVLICFLFFALCNTAIPAISLGEDSPTHEPLVDQNNQQTEQAPASIAAPEQKTEAARPEVTGDLGITARSSNPVVTRAVARNIALFTETIRERFTLWLQRSGKYLVLMKDILRQNNVPEDIAFLPLIESGFSPNAYSVARAVGPWQFIAETGKRYGLRIDWWRDERRDPVKSTEAAANYLKDLYEMFGSWNLAMAAYNAGEGKILKALDRSRSDDYWSLLNTRYIKNETKEYVPRFIAAKQIAMDPKAYGFENIAYHAPFEYDEVVIDRPVDLKVAAICAQTTEDAVRELNPELRRWSTPANVPSYALRIPSGKKDLFIENLAKISEEERFTITSYTVRKGDTLKKIAARTGVPISVIVELNKGLGAPSAGSRIFLPPKDKFCLDRDDKATIKKAAYQKPKKRKSNKKVIASLHKKDAYIND